MTPSRTVATPRAAQAEHKSDKARLQELAVQWRSVAADKECESARSTVAAGRHQKQIFLFFVC
jgi:hypothetical protein